MSAPKDPEKRKAYNERMRIYMRARPKTPELRERVLRNNKTYRSRVRKAVIAVLGGVCVRCGFADERALQVDHIDGGGSQEFKRLGPSVYLKALKDRTGYQLLCANCNWIKRIEDGEHQKSLPLQV